VLIVISSLAAACDKRTPFLAFKFITYVPCQ